MQFMEELPEKLRLDLAVEIHQKMLSTVAFFIPHIKKEDNRFIGWVGTVIKPLKVREESFITKENDKITEMYFLVKG